MGDFTEFLQEFGDVQFDSASSDKPTGRDNLVEVSEQSSLEVASFDDTVESANEIVPYGERPITEYEVKSICDEECVQDTETSFEKLCIGVADFSDKVERVSSKVINTSKSFLNRSLAVFNSLNNLRIFQKGKMVIAGDFKFLLTDNQLMLLQYTGSSNVVIIPDTVGGIPVTYVHGSAFKKGHFKATTKLQNVIHSLKGDELKLYSVSSVIYAMKGITTLQLPAGLKYLPDGIFQHCTDLHTIEVPEGVENIAPGAFKGTNIKSIIFSNKCVSNMKYVYVPKDVEVFLRKDVAHTYWKVFALSEVL